MSDFEKNHQENSLFDETNENNSEEQIIDYQERDKKLKINLYKLIGLLIVILSVIIIPLIIITFFYHPGQPDTTALFIEQIFGFVLASIGLIIGSIMLAHSFKLRKEKIILDSVLVHDNEVEKLKDS